MTTVMCSLVSKAKANAKANWPRGQDHGLDDSIQNSPARVVVGSSNLFLPLPHQPLPRGFRLAAIL